MDKLYEIEVQKITGENVKLSEYKDKVLLIVNTASKCGFTYQYEGLENLYKKYKDEGFVILGFPSNDFLGQEPGSNEEIQSFCKVSYGITFPMFAKITVKGSKKHPLYKNLTSGATNPDTKGKITWNFNKFLVSRAGNVSARFDTRTKPENKKVIEAIEQEL